MSAGFRRAAAGVLVAAALAGSCRRSPGPTAEQVALELRDVFPYPAITGGTDAATPELRPLLPGYLVYVKGEDFGAAAAEFERVGRRHPELMEARLLQGISLVLAERPAEAIPALESVVARHAGYPPARWFLAQALLATGRRQEALDQLGEVDRLDGLYAAEARRVLEAERRHAR